MNQNTVTIRNTLVGIGELPRMGGYHCYMMYAIDEFNAATNKVCLKNPVAINVHQTEIEPTDVECQAIIKGHEQCPKDISEVEHITCGIFFRDGSRQACTFFCVDDKGEIIKQLHHACL